MFDYRRVVQCVFCYPNCRMNSSLLVRHSIDVDRLLLYVPWAFLADVGRESQCFHKHCPQFTSVGLHRNASSKNDKQIKWLSFFWEHQITTASIDVGTVQAKGINMLCFFVKVSPVLRTSPMQRCSIYK